MEHSNRLRRANCPACNSAQFKYALSCIDYTVSKESFDLVDCQGCGLRFTNPIPEPSNLGDYYKSEEYISHSDTSKGIVAKIYHLVRTRALKQKLKLVQKYSSGKTLLDYGCGTGAFLEVCANAGFQVSGVEPDSDARARIRKDLNVFPELTALKAKRFDTVTMWHVLEHVYDLRGLLSDMSAMLNPGGTLIIAVPNYKSLDAASYGAHWAAYDVPRHLYHFEAGTLLPLVDRYGFRSVETLPMLFDSFYVSMLSEKYRNGKLGFFKGAIKGLQSNLKARKTKQYSSRIYIFRRDK